MRLPLALLAAASLALAQAPSPALAQEDYAAEGGEQKATARPFDGYFATGLLVGLLLFIVGKSARR